MDLGHFLQTAAHAAQAFTPNSSPIVDLIAPWVRSLSLSAPSRWLPVLAEHAACAHRAGSRRCGARAVVACVACGRRICLSHALVGADANGVCHDCVTDVASRKSARQVERKELRAEPVKPKAEPQRRVPAAFEGVEAALQSAYETLGCLPSDTDDEVEHAYNVRMKFATNKAEKALLVKSFERIAKSRV